MTRRYEMDRATFFTDIKPFDNFQDVFTPAHYQPVPEDWLIAVCDIQGSTVGIADGKYKDINTVGASAIIAVLNAAKGIELPYVFGGDGAGFAIPPRAVAQVAAALRGTQAMARDAFGLTLRAGLVPISDIRAAGHDVRVARYRLSGKIAIAMFDGGGLSAADEILKDSRRGAAYNVVQWSPDDIAPDFSGLECRWKPLKTERGQIVTLIARTRDGSGSDGYRELFRNIEKICGERGAYCPMRGSALRLSLAPKQLQAEQKVRSYGRNTPSRTLSTSKILAENIVGKVIFQTGIKLGSMDGKQYIQDVAQNADFQKFDDTLRMVMDNTPQQTTQLIAYLAEEHSRGRIFYGTHVETEAIITCLIFDRADRHLHFIDGAQGGYAAAARAMKHQIANETNMIAAQAITADIPVISADSKLDEFGVRRIW